MSPVEILSAIGGVAVVYAIALAIGAEASGSFSAELRPAIIATAVIFAPVVTPGAIVFLLSYAVWLGASSVARGLAALGRSYAALWRSRPRRRPKPDDAIPRAEVRR